MSAVITLLRYEYNALSTHSYYPRYLYFVGDIK